MPRFPPPVKSFGGFGPRLITVKPLRGLSPLFGVSACSGKTAPSFCLRRCEQGCVERRRLWVLFFLSFFSFCLFSFFLSFYSLWGKNKFLPRSTKLSTRASFTECLFGWRSEPSELKITCGIFWKCQKTYDRGFILWSLKKKVEKLS